MARPPAEFVYEVVALANPGEYEATLQGRGDAADYVINGVKRYASGARYLAWAKKKLLVVRQRLTTMDYERSGGPHIVPVERPAGPGTLRRSRR